MILQRIRKFFGLSDSQPNDLSEIIASGVQELGYADDVVSAAELAASAENALGDYPGRPDYDLASSVGQAMAGMLVPGKKVRDIKVEVTYEDDVPQVILFEQGNLRGVFVERYGDTISVKIDKVFVEDRPESFYDLGRGNVAEVL